MFIPFPLSLVLFTLFLCFCSFLFISSFRVRKTAFQELLAPVSPFLGSACTDARSLRSRFRASDDSSAASQPFQNRFFPFTLFHFSFPTRNPPPIIILRFFLGQDDASCESWRIWKECQLISRFWSSRIGDLCSTRWSWSSLILP